MIVADPQVQAGVPTIRGTRIPTRAPWGFWCAGYALEAIQREYPSLSLERIVAAIVFERRRRQGTRLRVRPRHSTAQGKEAPRGYDTLERVSPNAERRTPNAEPERPTILVVEDDASLRALLCVLLEAEGYAPVGATDGADALRRLDAGLAPVLSLVTLDLRMPVMDGWAFLRHYGARGVPPPHAPVLVITALASNGHTIGPDVAGVIGKPFALDDLLARVRALAPLPAGA